MENPMLHELTAEAVEYGRNIITTSALPGIPDNHVAIVMPHPGAADRGLRLRKTIEIATQSQSFRSMDLVFESSFGQPWRKGDAVALLLIVPGMDPSLGMLLPPEEG